MTRDEVMALSDEELRRKSAVLMGELSWDIPDPIGSIATAWRLVERMERRGYGISLCNDGSGGWVCAIWDGQEIAGETASLALTRAFVLAMTGDPDARP